MENKELFEAVSSELKSKKTIKKDCGCDVTEQTAGVQSGLVQLAMAQNEVHPYEQLEQKCSKFEKGTPQHKQCMQSAVQSEEFKQAVYENVVNTIVYDQLDEDWKKILSDYIIEPSVKAGNYVAGKVASGAQAAANQVNQVVTGVKNYMSNRAATKTQRAQAKAQAKTQQAQAKAQAQQAREQAIASGDPDQMRQAGMSNKDIENAMKKRTRAETDAAAGIGDSATAAAERGRQAGEKASEARQIRDRVADQSGNIISRGYSRLTGARVPYEAKTPGQKLYTAIGGEPGRGKIDPDLFKDLNQFSEKDLIPKSIPLVPSVDKLLGKAPETKRTMFRGFTRPLAIAAGAEGVRFVHDATPEGTQTHDDALRDAIDNFPDRQLLTRGFAKGFKPSDVVDPVGAVFGYGADLTSQIGAQPFLPGNKSPRDLNRTMMKLLGSNLPLNNQERAVMGLPLVNEETEEEDPYRTMTDENLQTIVTSGTPEEKKRANAEIARRKAEAEGTEAQPEPQTEPQTDGGDENDDENDKSDRFGIDALRKTIEDLGDKIPQMPDFGEIANELEKLRPKEVLPKSPEDVLAGAMNVGLGKLTGGKVKVDDLFSSGGKFADAIMSVGGNAPGSLAQAIKTHYNKGKNMKPLSPPPGVSFVNKNKVKAAEPRARVHTRSFHEQISTIRDIAEQRNPQPFDVDPGAATPTPTANFDSQRKKELDALTAAMGRGPVTQAERDSLPSPEEMKRRDKEEREVFDKFDNLLLGRDLQGPTRPVVDHRAPTRPGEFMDRDGRGLAGLEAKLGIPSDERFKFTVRDGQLKTLDSFRDMQDRLRRYEPIINKRLETARKNLAATRARSQRNQAQRDAPRQETSYVGDPERYEFYASKGVKPTGEPTGAEGDRPSFTLDDKMGYHIKKEVEKRQKKGDYRLPGGGYDYAAMAQIREQVKTPAEVGNSMRGDSSSGYPSRFPGSMVGPAGRRRSTTPRTAAEQEAQDKIEKQAQREMDFKTDNPGKSVADMPDDYSRPSAEDLQARRDRAAAKRQAQQNDPAYLAGEEQRVARAGERKRHKDRVRAEITNRRRAARGMAPLDQSQMIGTEASKAASGVATIADRQAGLQSRITNLTGGGDAGAGTQSAEDYMDSVLPGGAYNISTPKDGPKGATTYEKPDGSGFSTVPPKNPFDIIGNIVNQNTPSQTPSTGTGTEAPESEQAAPPPTSGMPRGRFGSPTPGAAQVTGRKTGGTRDVINNIMNKASRMA